MARFPTSCVQAYEELCRRRGLVIDDEASSRIRQAARSVFENDATLISGARETLTILRARGARIALLTKGDPELQARRVERSGLRDLFDVIRIVPEKTPEVFRDILTALGVEKGSAWMVGNSIRSDIVPAIGAGLNAVWINAHVWEYERTLLEPPQNHVIKASDLKEVPELIGA